MSEVRLHITHTMQPGGSLLLSSIRVVDEQQKQSLSFSMQEDGGVKIEIGAHPSGHFLAFWVPPSAARIIADQFYDNRLKRGADF